MSRSKTDKKDSTLFRRSIGEVVEIRHDNVIPKTRKPAPRPLQKEADEAAVIDEIANGFFDVDNIENGDELLYKRSGVRNRQFEKLRRGRFVIEDELDLHGLTVPVAKKALAEFLLDCAARNRCCVRIIHGKGRGSRHGKPVIKSLVPGWLQQRDEVLAYSSARRVDGGSGALYVLLKRR